MPPTPRYEDDSICPSSTLVTASQLRDYVVALSDDEAMMEEDRRQFVESNTLPGANFNDDFVLINPDQVCPDGWPNRALVSDDLDAVFVDRFYQIEDAGDAWCY